MKSQLQQSRAFERRLIMLSSSIGGILPIEYTPEPRLRAVRKSRRSLRHRFASALHAVSRWLIQYCHRHATLKELQRLSDAQLRDIGLVRSEIPQVVEALLQEAVPSNDDTAVAAAARAPKSTTKSQLKLVVGARTCPPVRCSGDAA